MSDKTPLEEWRAARQAIFDHTGKLDMLDPAWSGMVARLGDAEHALMLHARSVAAEAAALAAQSPEAAAARQAEIDEDAAVLREVSVLGAMRRLLGKCDFDLVQDWITGEKIMGVPAHDRFAVAAAVCAQIVALNALSVQQPEIAVNDMMNQIGDRVLDTIANIRAGAKAGAKLRLVKG